MSSSPTSLGEGWARTAGWWDVQNIRGTEPGRAKHVLWLIKDGLGCGRHERNHHSMGPSTWESWEHRVWLPASVFPGRRRASAVTFKLPPLFAQEGDATAESKPTPHLPLPKPHMSCPSHSKTASPHSLSWPEKSPDVPRDHSQPSSLSFQNGLAGYIGRFLAQGTITGLSNISSKSQTPLTHSPNAIWCSFQVAQILLVVGIAIFARERLIYVGFKKKLR